jgi:hypothetical protein
MSDADADDVGNDALEGADQGHLQATAPPGTDGDEWLGRSDGEVGGQRDNGGNDDRRLSSGEVVAMVVWSFKMTVVFEEIVALILRSLAPVGSGTYLYSTMETSDALDNFPAVAATLLAHLMKHAPPEFDSPRLPDSQEARPSRER